MYENKTTILGKFEGTFKCSLFCFFFFIFLCIYGLCKSNIVDFGKLLQRVVFVGSLQRKKRVGNIKAFLMSYPFGSNTKGNTP